MAKRIAIGILVVLVLVQFFRPTKNLDPHRFDTDIFETYAAPGSVRQIVTQACYDCHSNNTRYPWYAEVQPVGWWLASHVSDGKRELNFSEFGRYSAKRAAHKLQAANDQLDDNEMPLPSYRWIHAEARLSAQQKKEIEDWFAATRSKIIAAAPAGTAEH